MSDQNFNLKSFKPTMKPPSDMGKKIDTGFKSKMRNAGVNMNSIKENNIPLNEKEESLKKKIFSLPKMETLVMTDEYLSNIYNKLKQDAQETYGYHWNETIMNILFNEYVLDDAGYLQKYKNTKTYNKKRRGQEGVEELEKELQNKVADVKASGDEPVLKRDKKVSDIDSNKDNLDKFKRGVKQDKENDAMANESQNEVAEKMKAVTEGLDKEMNELFGFGAPAPMTSHKASKNDTYFVDKGNNSAVGVISTNLTPQQNQETANKFAGNTLKYSRMPWFVAVQNKVKGVPQQVTDGSIADFQQDATKYAGVPALGETTGAASSGAYAPALDNQDNTYQNETTTSASSGAFVGPFPGKRKSVLDKPLWVGGTILKESKDYLGNPEAFKKYVEYVESIDKLEVMLNESVDEGTLSMKQHAQNVLNNLTQMTKQNPEVAQLPEFQETLSHWKQLALTGQAPNPEEHPQQAQQVSEDHLNTKEEKIDFIVKNSQGKWNSFPMAYTPEQLLAMTDEQVDQIYHTIEHEAGVNENEVDEMFGFGGGGMGSRLNVGSSPSSLKGAGSPQLTKLRGDMRDKMFATNLSGYKNHVINALRRMPSGDKVIGVLDKIYDQIVDTNMRNSVSPEETAQQVLKHWSGVAESKASNRINKEKIHINENPSFKDAMVKDINFSRGKASDSESAGELEAKDGLFKGKWNNNEDVSEKAVSKAQQQFMGMVHAEKKGELKNPSPAVKKAASSMTDKAATDYASTKQAGLPDHVDEMGNDYLMGWPNKSKMITPKENPFDKVQFADNSKHTASDENIFVKIAKLVFPETNKNSQELTALGQKFVHDFFGTTPPERAYDLLYKKYQTMNLAENKTINHADYKEFFKNKLKASGKSLGSMSPEEKESFFAMVDNEYQSKGEQGVQESMVDDQPDSMARTMDSPELNVSGAPMGGSSAPVAEAAPEVDVEDRESDQGDRQSKEANADAAKFREFLQSKYGVQSVAELSPRQKQQVMKDMDAARAANAPAEEKPTLDLKNFAATDAEKASYQARDNQQLGFVAQNNDRINTIQDYLALEKQYAQEKGEKMFHPMAILASIQAMPPQERAQFSNVERVLTTQMKGGNVQESKEKSKQNNMNEERMSNSMLNLQKIKKETAAIATKQMADADALKQAKVYPNPDEFYIEQDKDKIQKFKTGEEIEKESLAKMEELKALENVGNSTGGDSTTGNDAAPKRNLTKEEKLRLAMDRGDGMHNIVYDNKPSEKFEKRLKKDMGEDQYKLRQEKIKYREDMPSYNKDTQPVETGDDKAQDTKFKKGYNEAFTGKYTNDYGKSKLVEFQLEDTEEVTSINEGSFLLTLEGLGNKYTQKINESKIFADVIKDYDFYLMENKVVMIKRDPNAIPAAPVEPEVITETIMNKMNHLIGYNSNEFVNTKKSVKF